ncbi:hypothetical protein PTSG_10134 [Salpingoeca rosetta]|uniref:VWFA domain-containing protein n=1 Tax=Salpingoeca rosetta (strain ATCC 50818 / BSB-021) TaxID=946362 RepID=F2UQE6_SALR5|nr:uncharacterized protein PTSG_10134 [Salpingoeca rosetta]EGD79851.1 hypothetical protein PTSG_10134 [Salpingoeca rosetta]|eukprot:XP_004988472.1 hypothetical protein PTSG_10134 [Salpingoeca rosetta]
MAVLPLAAIHAVTLVAVASSLLFVSQFPYHCIAGSPGIVPGYQSPPDLTEAEVTGVPLDYLDASLDAPAPLVNFKEFSEEFALEVQFAQQEYQLMTLRTATMLQMLVASIEFELLVKNGYEPRPDTPTQAPELRHVGRALALGSADKPSSASADVLAEIAEYAREVGFEFISIPDNIETDNYVYVSTVQADCRDHAADVLFILDSSGDVDQDFSQLRSYAVQTASRFDISPSQTRIAFMTYATTPSRLYTLNAAEFLSADELLAHAATENFRGGFTNTGAALAAARQAVFGEKYGMRPAYLGIPRIAVLFVSHSAHDSFIAPARQLREHGVTVIVVGTGSVSTNEMALIASEPVSENVIRIGDVPKFVVLPQLVAATMCRQPVIVDTANAVLVRGLPPRAFRFYRLNPMFKRLQRINFFMEMFSGQTDVFVSMNGTLVGPYHHDIAYTTRETAKAFSIANFSSFDAVTFAVQGRPTSLITAASFRLNLVNAMFTGGPVHAVSLPFTAARPGKTVSLPPLEATGESAVGTAVTLLLQGFDNTTFIVTAGGQRVRLTQYIMLGDSHRTLVLGRNMSDPLNIGGVLLQHDNYHKRSKAYNQPNYRHFARHKRSHYTINPINDCHKHHRRHYDTKDGVEYEVPRSFGHVTGAVQMGEPVKINHTRAVMYDIGNDGSPNYDMPSSLQTTHAPTAAAAARKTAHGVRMAMLQDVGESGTDTTTAATAGNGRPTYEEVGVTETANDNEEVLGFASLSTTSTTAPSSTGYDNIGDDGQVVYASP